jgi:hypothetical protein
LINIGFSVLAVNSFFKEFLASPARSEESLTCHPH